MPSFEDLERLFDKFPVWKCPGCRERKREQFTVVMQIQVEIPIAEFEHLEKTMFAAWRDGVRDLDNYTDVQVCCLTCGKSYPLPEGWKLVMR